MTDESRFTTDDAPEIPVPEDVSVPDAAEPVAQPAGDAAADGPEAVGQEASGVKDAWRDVITQLDVLGDSMSRWAKAAINDPENRRHAAEIRSKFDTMSAKITSAVDEATHTEVGRTVSEAADRTGRVIADAGGKVAQETVPAVASALGALAELVGKTAERVGRAAERSTAVVGEPAGDEPSAPESAPADSDSDPAPAQGGGV